MSIGDASAADSDGTAEPSTQGSGDAGGSAESSGSDETPQACDGDSSCGDAVPAGWSGPFALATMAPPAANPICPQGWIQQALGFRDLASDPALCGCECASLGGSCNAMVSYYSDAGCTTATESGASAGDCEIMSTGEPHGYVRATGVADGASCVPSPLTVVPPPAWSEGAMLCAPPPADACADGPCLPALPPGFDDRWCVTAEGEQTCPAGPYSELNVMHRGVAYTRGCSPCACNLQGAPSCGGSITEYYDVFCVVPAGGIPVDGGCHGSDLSGQSNWAVNYDPPAPSFACASNGPTPLGSAMPSEPITVCCAP